MGEWVKGERVKGERVKRLNRLNGLTGRAKPGRNSKRPIHPFTIHHSPIHSFTHSPIHSFTHSPIHPFTHSPIHVSRITFHASHPVPSTSSITDQLLQAARRLRLAVDRLSFGPPVSHVYNPLAYAWPLYDAYLRKFAANRKSVVFLGMNPGPFGMVQTGV